MRKSVVFTVSLPGWLKIKMDKYCEERSITRSRFIRDRVEEFLVSCMGGSWWEEMEVKGGSERNSISVK